MADTHNEPMSAERMEGKSDRNLFTERTLHRSIHIYTWLDHHIKHDNKTIKVSVIGFSSNSSLKYRNKKNSAIVL
jgi:hypothetical protein